MMSCAYCMTSFAPTASVRIRRVGDGNRNMSSHWEWAEEVWRKHEAEKPYAPENGQPLKFKPGDLVQYTNPVGVVFQFRVTRLYTPRTEFDSLYARGARYYLDWECPWYPVAEASLQPIPNENMAA